MAVQQPNLYAVRMKVRVRQDLSHDPSSPLAGALVLLEDYVHHQTRADVLALLSASGLLHLRSPMH